MHQIRVHIGSAVYPDGELTALPRLHSWIFDHDAVWKRRKRGSKHKGRKKRGSHFSPK